MFAVRLDRDSPEAAGEPHGGGPEVDSTLGTLGKWFAVEAETGLG